MSHQMVDYKYLARRKWYDFFGELWLRYQYRVACWEIERQAKHAAEWRWAQMVALDKLRQLGVNPEEYPEDLTRMFEVWLVAGFLLLAGLACFLFVQYRETLVEVVRRAM